MKKLFRILPLLIWAATHCQGSTILLNPDFEDDDLSPWERTAISGIRPWVVGSATPQSGARYLFTVDEARIRQNFTPILGSEVTEFTFWVDRPFNSTMSVELFYAVGGSSGQIDITSNTGSGYGLFDVAPLIDVNRELTGFSLTKLGTGTARLDNFTLTVIPEPSTTFLLLCGLIGVIRRRKRFF